MSRSRSSPIYSYLIPQLKYRAWTKDSFKM